MVGGKHRRKGCWVAIVPVFAAVAALCVGVIK